MQHNTMHSLPSGVQHAKVPRGTERHAAGGLCIRGRTGRRSRHEDDTRFRFSESGNGTGFVCRWQAAQADKEVSTRKQVPLIPLVPLRTLGALGTLGTLSNLSTLSTYLVP